MAKTTEPPEREFVRRVTEADDYYLAVSRLTASRSRCLRSQVGCVIANKGGIIAVGYNGVPKGAQHCIELGCAVEKKEYCRGVHAEQNAINQAAFLGRSTKDASFYIASFKCNMCARSIINAGMKEIVCYVADEGVTKYLSSMGVKVRIIGRQK